MLKISKGVISFLRHKLNSLFFAQVVSNSMAPLFAAGDTILIRRSDHKTIKVGDVIVFVNGVGNAVIAHRVVGIVKTASRYGFVTQGDASRFIDRDIVSGKQLLGSILCLPFDKNMFLTSERWFPAIQRYLFRFSLLRSLVYKTFF